MPSANPTLSFLSTTNNNTHRKDKIYDATVVANYGDPGLQEDYFADILSPLHKLVVEVDGGYHGEQTQQLMDFRRSLFLKNSGYSIIRVKNEQVNHDAGGIALAIMNAADGRAKKKKRR